MALSPESAKPYMVEMANLYEDASYTAQAYFEATKSAEFWGRAMVFLPALVGAIAGILVAVGGAKEWGAVSAVAGAVAATASFLGSERKAASFKDSARRLTALRHRVAMERRLATKRPSESDLETVLRTLRESYETVALASEPVPGRAFRRAQRRIDAGALKYTFDAPS